MTRVITGDAIEMLRTLPAASVHCVVTSPPYWNLRSYLPDGHPDKANELALIPACAEMSEVWGRALNSALQQRAPQPDGAVAAV